MEVEPQVAILFGLGKVLLVDTLDSRGSQGLAVGHQCTLLGQEQGIKANVISLFELFVGRSQGYGVGLVGASGEDGGPVILWGGGPKGMWCSWWGCSSMWGC